tara:strand:+ start:720 stop:902 length:183 start_codon:yes stop_codon:yes gene_type:complete
MSNLYDFTEFKLHALMERAASTGDEEIAEAYRICLDEYLLGNIAISFQNGFPVIIDTDDT